LTVKKELTARKELTVVYHKVLTRIDKTNRNIDFLSVIFQR
jgi:hypothetical protein